MKPKILVVTTIGATIRAFLYPHLQFFEKKGYEIVIASNFDQSHEVKKQLKDLNYKVYDVPFSRNPFEIKRIIGSVKVLKEIKKHEKISLLYTHTPIASFLSRFVFRNRNEEHKNIYFAHGLHFYTKAPVRNWLIFYPIEKIALGWTDVLITINNEDYTRMKKMSKNTKIIKFPGVGLKPEFVNSIKENLGCDKKELLNKTKTNTIISEEDFVVLSIGELNDNKNQISIIKAVEEIIINKKRNIKYLIVGEGINKEKLENYIYEKNLSNNVFLMGFRSDIAELLLLSDLLVSMSFREGLPINVLESMYASKPVILSNVRGHKDLVKNKKFLIDVNSKNDKKLSDLLLEFILNEDLRVQEGQENLKISLEYLLPNVLYEINELLKSL